jgi:hypothetical protein
MAAKRFLILFCVPPTYLSWKIQAERYLNQIFNFLANCFQNRDFHVPGGQ